MNWKLDINQLADELPRLHNNFFQNLSKDEFYDHIEKLLLLEKNMNVYSIVVELSKIIALAGDAHTAIEIPKDNMLPIECYWFEEGIYITKTTEEFGDILHNKIIEICGTAIADVIEKITEMISHENIQFVKSQLPELLVCTDILYGLGIAVNVDQVELKIEDQNGRQFNLFMPAVKHALREKMFDFEICDAAGNNKKKIDPLFRRKRELYYWNEKIQDEKILYVNYKKCREMDTISTENFVNEIKGILENDIKIEGIVLDYRNNNGGNSELFRPFIEWLSDFQKYKSENLKSVFKIFVIVGRDTFSSALLNVYLLKFKTKAIFIGEATGGKPDCYGEVKYFKLRESGLSVRYSTKYYYLIEEYWQDSFYPEINFSVKFMDYLEKRDPCIEWIKENT